MRIQVPRVRTRRVAERARQLAMIYGRKRGWKSTENLLPVYEPGVAGLKVQQKHLIYQNEGTKPRDMVELEGKTIPMPDGRFVRAKGVGKPGYVTLPGGVKVWRDRKWHHPGIKATHFMDDALAQATREEVDRGFFRRTMGRQWW